MKRTLFAGLIVLLAGPLAAAATIEVESGNEVFINPAADQIVTLYVYGNGVETTRDFAIKNSLINGPSSDLKFREAPPQVPFGPDTNDTYHFRTPGYLFASSGVPNGWSFTTPSRTEARDSDTFGVATLIPGTDSASRVGLVDIFIDASAAPLGTWDLTFTSLAYDISEWVEGTATTDFASLTFQVTVVPEPAVLLQLLALAGMGGLGVLFVRRKKLAG